MSNEAMDQHALNSGRTFTWHELYVPDEVAAGEFYTEALGFGTQDHAMADGSNYKMLTKDGHAVCGVWSTKNPQMEDTPAHWAVYLAVDDLDARLEKCVSLGASVVVPAMDIPEVGRMAMIADPQGAHIWLYKSAHA